MRTSKSGLSLIEFGVIVAVLGILSATIGFWYSSCTRGSEEAATTEMKSHVEKIGWIYVGGACAGSDEDGDGYISCTARVRVEQGGNIIDKELSCASGALLSKSSGCKARNMFPFGGNSGNGFGGGRAEDPNAR